jgi:hypothetical protein
MLDIQTAWAQIESFKALRHELESGEDIRRILLKPNHVSASYRRILVWLASLMIACGEYLRARYAV